MRASRVSAMLQLKYKLVPFAGISPILASMPTSDLHRRRSLLRRNNACSPLTLVLHGSRLHQFVTSPRLQASLQPEFPPNHPRLRNHSHHCYFQAGLISQLKVLRSSRLVRNSISRRPDGRRQTRPGPRQRKILRPHSGLLRRSVIRPEEL
jgi:hypothetical protein